MKNLVAERYAEAFFEVALKDDKLDHFKEELQTIKQTLMDNDELMLILKHPETSKDEKKKVILEIFEGMDIFTLNFLKVLIDKERIRNIFEIYDEYVELVYEHQGKEVAYVYSASELDDEDKKELYTFLKQRRQKEVICEYIVDKALIAGVKIDIKGEVMDNSIAAQLEKLKHNVDRVIS